MLVLILSCLCAGPDPETTSAPAVTDPNLETPIRWVEHASHPQVKLEGDLLIVEGKDVPTVVELADIPNPPVAMDNYLVRTKVRYEGIVGEAFIDMWNYFSDGSSYFTRNLAPSGPMGKFAGDSNEREVVLPFTSVPGVRPNRITVSLVLPGRGKIWIEPMFLSNQITPGEHAGFANFVAMISLGTIFLMWVLPVAIAVTFALGLIVFRLAGLSASRFIRLLWVGGVLGLMLVGLGFYLWLGVGRNPSPLLFLPSMVAGGALAMVCLVSIGPIKRAQMSEETKRMRELDLWVS